MLWFPRIWQGLDLGQPDLGPAVFVSRMCAEVFPPVSRPPGLPQGSGVGWQGPRRPGYSERCVKKHGVLIWEVWRPYS